MRKGQSFQQVVLEQLDIHMQKKAVRPLCHTLEINSKIEHRPECKSQNKRLEENIGINLYNLGLDNDFLGMRTKEKIYMKKYIIKTND